MLTFDQLDALTNPVANLYQDYVDTVINDIVRRLVKLDYSSPSAAWQVQRLNQAGMLYDDILERLTGLTGKSEPELHSIFKEAGVKAMKFDDSVYLKSGLKPLPLNLSPAMVQVLAAGLNKTMGVMRNLTMTTAITGQEAFISAADLAYMQISTGAFDYNAAIRQAVKRVAQDGLPVVNYANNHQEQLDVAMRRTVLTGINQTTGNLQIARANEMGANLVSVSAHIGARNKGSGPMNHESWQGKVYSLNGATKKYPNFEETTGYGTGVGLMGWNCRHNFHAYIEGVSESSYSQAELNDYADKMVSYNGEKMSVYEATQKQRAIEREIRKTKREADALDTAKLPNGTEKMRIRKLQAKMRDFIRQTGLDRQYPREQI